MQQERDHIIGYIDKERDKPKSTEHQTSAGRQNVIIINIIKGEMMCVREGGREGGTDKWNGVICGRYSL